jgi:nucleotide-binding universal stress UspA family protein
MKYVLLLTDFSDTARNAIIYTLNMLKDENLYYKLINTYDLEFSGSPYVMQVKDELAEESIKGLRNELQLIHRIFPKAKIELASRFGPLIDVIKDEIKEYNPDLIVLGNKGETAIEHFLLGSNAYEIIKKITTPLLVVPKGAEYRKPDKIVFATDLNDFKDDNIVKPVRDIVKYFDAKLIFVNVLEGENENRSEAEQKILSHFPDIDYSFHYVEGDNVIQKIREFMDEQDIDIGVIIRHNVSFFDRLLHPSVTKKMLLQPKHTLIVLHDEVVKE